MRMGYVGGEPIGEQELGYGRIGNGGASTTEHGRSKPAQTTTRQTSPPTKRFADVFPGGLPPAKHFAHPQVLPSRRAKLGSNRVTLGSICKSFGGCQPARPRNR